MFIMNYIINIFQIMFILFVNYLLLMLVLNDPKKFQQYLIEDFLVLNM